MDKDEIAKSRKSKRELKDQVERAMAQLTSKQEKDLTSAPEWVERLIEFDANPMNPFSDSDLSTNLGITLDELISARKKYPNYAMSVAYRRQKYMSEFGNFCMKNLVKRIKEKSDLALKMGLEISQVYVPSQKIVNEFLTPEAKRLKIKKLLGKIEKTQGDSNVTKASV